MSNLSDPIIQGWFLNARHVISPHCDARPNGIDADLVVLHAISLPPEEFGNRYIDDLFLGRLDPDAHPYFKDLKGLRVSAHLLIRRDGELVQYVPFHLRAWHAGSSSYQGRERCNDFSIGIELEGSDNQAFTAQQYTTLNRCLNNLFSHYPTLSREHVTGHSDIAPGRKTDPGPYFDWEKIS